MMKKFSLFILFVFVSITSQVYCSHTMGGDMEYEYLGNSQYKISFKIYRDCRGISLSGIGLNYYAGISGGNSCGGGSISGVKRTAIRDITTRCSTAAAPCSSPNTAMQGQGIEEHCFEVVVDFTKAPLSNLVGKSSCCEVTFWTGQCCRSGAVTTGSAGQNFAIRCMINLCNIEKTKVGSNSSVKLTTPPLNFICCNSPITYNPGALDTIDNDSISYKLVSGIQSIPSNYISYSNPLSSQIPITPFCIPVSTVKCTPQPNLSTPRGFYFDTSSGDMVFQPTNCKEVGVIVMEFTEHRKDTLGNWLVVGKTMREMTAWILSQCGYNKPPKIESPQYFYVCEGDKICKTIKITDETFTPYQSTPDTVVTSWNNGISSGTFKVIDSSQREKSYQFCWQTKKGDANETPYSFTITANDQHCSPPLISTKSFKVKVLPKPNVQIKLEPVKCCFYNLIVVDDNYNDDSSWVKWDLFDSSNQQIPTKSGKGFRDTFEISDSKTYYLRTLVSNDKGCQYWIVDTLKLSCIIDSTLARDSIRYTYLKNKEVIFNNSVNSSYQTIWQTKFPGFEWVNIINSNYYVGNKDSLVINSVKLSNDNQKFRALFKDGICNDTTSITTLIVDDSCLRTIYNYDTVIINDTIITSTTDTLIIDAKLLDNNKIVTNTIKLYPNPANEYLIVDFGEYKIMSGFTISIIDINGKKVHSSTITSQQLQLNLSNWSGEGVYLVQFNNANGQLLESRKILIR